MKQDDKLVDVRRRKFLGQAVTASAGTVVAAALPTAALAGSEEAAREPQKKGYQLSQHILDYYKSAAS